MKIKKLKYIFLLFVGVLYIGFSNALLEVDDPSLCSQVEGYHSVGYSSNPQGNEQGHTTISSRYFNNQKALAWWYNENKANVLNENSNVINKKKASFSFFDSRFVGNFSFEGVWYLQNALHIAGCGGDVKMDCKLGKDTSNAFFNCQICSQIDASYTDSIINSNGELDCNDDTKEFVSEGDGAGYCCKKKTCESRGLSGQVEGGSCADGYKPAEDPNGDCCVKKTCEEKGFSGDAVGGSCGTGYVPSSDPECCNKAVCTDPDKEVNAANECDNGYSYDSSSACCKQDECSAVNEVYIAKVNGSCGAGYTGASDAEFCCEPETCSTPSISSDGGSCMTGYSTISQGSLTCCRLTCSGANEYLTGGTSPSNCQPCATGTIPNASHTKCVCDPSKKCCGIQLNMPIPFIGDCIENESSLTDGSDATVVNSITAFPILMQGIMKILMSVILIMSFLLTVVSAILMIAGGFSGGNFEKGKTMIKNVIVSMLLLGMSGLILKLINPSFFGG